MSTVFVAPVALLFSTGEQTHLVRLAVNAAGARFAALALAGLPFACRLHVRFPSLWPWSGAG